MPMPLHWITNFHFAELSTSVDLLERALHQEQKAVRERCMRELESIPEDIRETEDGIEILVIEREHELAGQIEQACEDIPRLLMKNMIVATWTVFECHMMGLVKSRIKAEADLSDEGFAAAAGIREMKHAMKHLRDRGFSLLQGWDFVDAIREVRNQIVHDGGARSDIDNVTDPVEMLRHQRTVRIDRFIADREANGKCGISYDYGALVVSADFCREVIDFLNEYVNATKRLTHIPISTEALKRRMIANGELRDSGRKGGEAGA